MNFPEYSASSHSGARHPGCPTCGKVLEADLQSPSCPECGALLKPGVLPAIGETLVLTGASESGNSSLSLAPNDESDSLVGEDFGAYRVVSVLGRGGMGTVYLVQHLELNRLCALKVMSPALAARDPEFISRFHNEGRAAAGLVHPNIVTVHAIGELDGLHFLEMEFVPGRSLAHLINAESRLTPTRSTALAARTADGLAIAHRSGIVHRDLKSDNVLMTHQGIPKIADFGLAMSVKSDRGAGEGLIGTPRYMAPELFQGGPATTASDVYALGVTYFQMLTGRLPFESAALNELMVAVTTSPVPNVRQFCPEISLEMSECLSLLLAKNPASRPRDGIEAAQLLHAILGHVRDLESLLYEAFVDDSSVSWTRENSRYRLELRLPDARRQTLFIEPSDHAAADRLLLIYSVCCDADPSYFEYALRLNSEIPHGGLAIRDIDGRPTFIMVDTYPRSTVDVDEIRRSVLEVAYRADAIEKLLTDLDHH